MKKNLTLILFFCFGIALAQNQANMWYFGNNAGLDFNNLNPTTGLPTPIRGQLSTFEGCASICDDKGNLLFYTNGEKVWDKNHNIMETGLNGDSSATHSSIIVPMPETTDKYYIFTVDVSGYYHKNKGFCYSIVDMSKRGGLGEVTTKNVELFTKKNKTATMIPYTNAEKVAATQHANGKDFWVVSHRYRGQQYNTGGGWMGYGAYSNEFYVYKISKAKGIELSGVYALGENHTDRRGSLKISHDGNYIASALVNDLRFGKTESYLELFNFNNTTGEITAKIGGFIKKIENFSILTIRDRYGRSSGYNPGYYGIEFSPNMKYMYYTVRHGGIYQINIDTGNIIPISTTSNANSLQLGADGRIYVALSDNIQAANWYSTDNKGGEYIGVIKNPDEEGVKCNYVNNAIKLLSGTCSYEGFPTVIQSFLSGKINTNGKLCLGDVSNFSVITRGYTEYEWDFGDGNNSIDKTPIHTYGKAGTYTVKLTLSNKLKTRKKILSKDVIVYPKIVFNIDDSTICYGTNITKSVPNTFNSYQWSNGGSTTHENTFKRGGNYWVEVTNVRGCKKRKDFKITELPEIGLSSQVTDNSIYLEIDKGNPPFNFSGISALENKDYRDRILSVDNIVSGKYTLTLVDKTGCTKSISILVKNLLMYNYFSPNGDGINDTWQIPNIEKLHPESIITIFDRRGKVLKRYKGKDGNWDGIYNGKVLPADTYWYQIKLPNDPKIIKGMVSIIK